MKKQVSVLAAIVLAALSTFIGIKVDRLRWEQKSAPDYRFVLSKSMATIHMQA